MKVIALFHLKYKAESNLGPFQTSYMELFVILAIFAKGSILDIGRGPRYASNKDLSKKPWDGCLYISWKQGGTKKHQSQQSQFWTTHKQNLPEITNRHGYLAILEQI